MATVTVEIVVGPARTPVTFTAENGNVRELLAAVRDEITTPLGATILVNGEAADDDTELDEGDEVAFTKPGGEKAA